MMPAPSCGPSWMVSEMTTDADLCKRLNDLALGLGDLQSAMLTAVSRIKAQAGEIEQLTAERDSALNRSDRQGHNIPCYWCGKPCNSLAGNPGQWPVPLCHADQPGRVKWHHIECVSSRTDDRLPVAERQRDEAVVLLRKVRPYVASETSRWANSIVKEDGLVLITRIDALLKEIKNE